MNERDLRRARILSPNTHAMPQVRRVTYQLRFTPGCDTVPLVVRLTFRPTHLVTHVEATGTFDLTSITARGQEQLASPVDAYFFSTKNMQLAYEEFLRAHGLLGKSDDEVTAYCDERELTPPGYMSVSLPTIGIADRMTFRVRRARESESVSVFVCGLEMMP